VISPIHKDEDKSIVNNYRPISLLNVFSKIFEKIIKKKTISIPRRKLYSTKNTIWLQRKLRYRRCTSSTLQRHIVYTNLEQKNKTLSIFMDLSKAFDSVSHKKLLYTLQAIGINNKPHKLFEPYLNNKK
jgi:hypothetical protein